MAARANGRRDTRRLLDVAVRLRYDACRVSDIAVEAGVAHGSSTTSTRSEEVLETVFRETW